MTGGVARSVQELEKKLYQDERPGNADFQEVLHLTSTGLTDGLTGVVTRTVFLHQLEAQWRSIPSGKGRLLLY